MSIKQNKSTERIECSCGRLLARVENGKVYVYCKRCKREIPLNIEELSAVEPGAVKD